MSILEYLTDDDHVQLMELLQESLRIKTHSDLFHWLQGRLQQHLPHDILIAAWGDFSIGVIYFDVISALPGVRTEKISSDYLTRFLKLLFTYWDRNGCAPSLLSMEECIDIQEKIGCEVIGQNFSNTSSTLVHAIKDFRGRHDCLYVLMSSSQTHSKQACTLFEALLPYIDTSLRKVAHLPKQLPNVALLNNCNPEPNCPSGISSRETEIMELVQKGKTNIEIGMILDISAFTVKNHLQRIFRKLDVSSRAQAVFKSRVQI